MSSMTSNGAHAAARSTRSWSIAGRLTYYYAGATLALLLLGGAFLYWGLARELRQQDEELVASKLLVLRHLIAVYPVGADALANEIVHEAGEEGPLHYYLRVRDVRGGTLVETPGMASLVPATRFPAAVRGPLPVNDCAECVPSEDGRYLMVAARSIDHGPDGVPRELQVALEVSATAHVLADYRNKLAAVLLAGLAIAVAVGVALARVALRPVHNMSEHVGHLTATQLDARLSDERDWPLELRGLARAFDALFGRLQDSFARLSQFSADLAHALRNPINNLRGEAEVALTRGRSPEEYQQVLSSSLEEFARLTRLIDGLLFLARAEDPHRAVERTGFPVRRELEAVCDFYEALAAERHIAVACDGDAWLVGDPILVRRAISNLLANALNHTPEHGRVWMVATEHTDGHVEVQVSDTGPGIADAHLPHVFERFYRVEDGQSRVTSGAGLGLAIVQSIMRLHGGTATVASPVGHGTTMSLSFPASAPGIPPVLDAARTDA